MRGHDEQTHHMFSYLSPEQRVPADHPLRAIRALTDEALHTLSRRFAGLYSQTGRPSIPPEQLLRALVLQVLYTVRSERLLMEELNYNLLFRWFVGLNMDDPVWHPTTFTKNRDRLLAGDVAAAFFDAVRDELVRWHLRQHGTNVDRREGGLAYLGHVGTGVLDALSPSVVVRELALQQPRRRPPVPRLLSRRLDGPQRVPPLAVDELRVGAPNGLSKLGMPRCARPIVGAVAAPDPLGVGLVRDANEGAGVLARQAGASGLDEGLLDVVGKAGWTSHDVYVLGEIRRNTRSTYLTSLLARVARSHRLAVDAMRETQGYDPDVIRPLRRDARSGVAT